MCYFDTMYFFTIKTHSMTFKYQTSAISATQELNALFKIDRTNRQTAWYYRLAACLPHAIFTSGQPEIIFNRAGFTYYNLELAQNIPKANNSTTHYTIPELVDTFLINEGVGIAIEARTPEHTLDLSHGDILGFHLYRTFAEPEDHPFKTDQAPAHCIPKGADLIINEVPAKVLPESTVKLLKDIMHHFGVKNAQIKLIHLPETKQNELVFSIDKNQIAPNKAQELLQKLGWFLPRYYSYLACDLNDVSSLIEDQH